MAYNKSAQGRLNRAEGQAFEDIITKSCERYKLQRIAFIEKTPEPFRVTRNIGRLSSEAKEAGGMHGVEYFGGKYGDGGNIVKIKYLGRKWEP